MSLQSIRRSPSYSEAQCPDCGVTLSRQSDLNRHRKTRHSDGTETKFSCPHPGCYYKATQRGNLKAHVDSIHSHEPKYPCPECGDRFGDAPARIRHRKNNHGYEPYHTHEYLTRQSLKGKEGVVQRVEKAVSNKTRRKRATCAAPYGLRHSPSSDAPPPKVLEVYYHDDFWKTLINMANYYAENPEEFQELKVNLPSANTPGHTPDAASQPGPDTSVQPVAPMQPFSPPSGLTSDESGFHTPQLDAASPQGQTSAWQPIQDNTAAFAAPSDPVFSLSPTGIDMTAFTPGVPPTYSGVDFLSHLQGFPTQLYGDVTSSMPSSATVPTISASSAGSCDLKLPFIPTSCEPASLFDPVTVSSWPSTSSQAATQAGTSIPVSRVPTPGAGWSLPPTSSLAPFGQFDVFAPGEAGDFDAWCQSYSQS